jgi:hypothetical protein
MTNTFLGLGSAFVGRGTATGSSTVPAWGDDLQMFALSQNLISQAESYASQLVAAAQTIQPQQINVAFPTISAPPRPVTTTLPDLIDVSFLMPGAPGAFQGTLDISGYLSLVNTFDRNAPTLNFGTAPTPFNGTVPPSPPIDLNFDYPTVSVTLPDPPSLMSLTNVVFNPLVIPTFDVSVPELRVVAPSILGFNEPSFYTSALLTALEASLLSAITNGQDTGLDAVTQQAMFDAAREREYRVQRDALDALDRDHEVLGDAFPHGVFVDARLKIYTETNNTLSGLSRDIFVKQMELRLENVTKAREEATALESTLIGYYNNIAQRAFEMVKVEIDASIAIYNAQVQAYAASLEGFKAEVLAYDALIKGITAQVEMYKAQIEFEQVKAQINTALVEQFKVETDAALAVLEVFKTQVAIIQVRAQVEKTKVDVFGAQVQAFVGQINAYTAQVEGYKAGIEAQQVIENVYKTQVEVYGIEVDAAVKAADALIAQYKGRIDAYTAQLEGYKAQLQGQVALAQAQTAFNTSEVEVFKGEVGALSAYNDNLTKQWEAILNEQTQIAQIAVKEAEANGQLYIASKNALIEALKVPATVMAQLGAASLNAIHWSNSSNWSMSTSVVGNTGFSESIADDHIFSEQA